MPNFATNPGAVVTPMSLAEMAAGLNCGALSIGQLNYLFQIALANAGPDVYLSGLQSYNPTTNTLVLLLTDGNTVNVDMTQLLADAISGGAAPIGVAAGSLAGTYPNPTLNPQPAATNLASDPIAMDTLLGALDDASAAQRGVVNLAGGQALGSGHKVIDSMVVGRIVPGGTAVGVGASAGATALYTVSFGQNAAANNSGSELQAVGTDAASGNTGDNANFLGSAAGRNNSGDNAVGIGQQAVEGNTGANAIGIGFEAMRNNTGNDSIGVGEYANLNNAFNNAVAIGATSFCTADNQFNLGNALTVEVRTAGQHYAPAYNITSDKRNKHDILAIDPSLAAEFSKQMSFYSFTLMQSAAMIASVNRRAVLAYERTKQELEAELLQAKDKNFDHGTHEEIKLVEVPDAESEPTGEVKEAVANEDTRRAPGDIQQDIKALAVPVPLESAEIKKAAGVIAQEVQELTAKLGAFQWLVTEDAFGELTVDYTGLLSIVSAGVQARLLKAGF